MRGVCKTLGVNYIEGDKPSSSEAVYRVVAGSFRDKKRAQNLMVDLKNKGYEAFVLVNPS